MMKMRSILTSKSFYEIVFCSVIIISFVLWLADIFLNGSSSIQYSTFFRSCEDFFADGLNVIGYNGDRDPYNTTIYGGLEQRAYPPLPYVFMYFFSRLVNMNVYYEQNRFLNMFYEPKFLIILLIVILILSVVLYELLRTVKDGNSKIKFFSACAVLGSMPMLYTLERANTIVLTLIALLIYIMFYDSENKLYKECALVALGFVAATKLTPAAFGIMLLYNKQWKEAIRAVIYGALLGFLPFFFFKGGMENFSYFLRNVGLDLGLSTGYSGCTLSACIVGVLQIETVSETMELILKYSMYVVVLLLLAFSFFYTERWKKVMAVTIIILIAPKHSNIYCLIYMIPAIILFLNEEKHKVSELMVLCAIFATMCPYRSYWLGDYNEHIYQLGILVMIAYLMLSGVSSLKDKLMMKKQSEKGQDIREDVVYE